jgi:lipopolysaccharide/colanic/teichoic acid biosynthesis glycosyltransferase
MSVVGPRPHMLKHTEEYGQLIDKFMVRHLVKPGITGWAQVNGYRGETRDHDLMVKRVEYDVWYLENWSILLDIKIVLITAFQIFSGKHQGG